MILKFLKEDSSGKASAKYSDVINKIKSLEPKLANLPDDTLNTILGIYLNDMGESEGVSSKSDIDAEKLVSWFNESQDIGNFLYDFAEDFSHNANSLITLAESDPAFVKAMKEFAASEKLVSSEGKDLDKDKPLSDAQWHKMFQFILKNLNSENVKLTDEQKAIIKSLPNDQLFDKKYDSWFRETKIVPELLEETLEDILAFYHPTAKTNEDLQEQPEPTKTIVSSAFLEVINTLIKKEWDLISDINASIATIESDFSGSNKEEINKILSEISDDTTINIGMLHKVSELVDSKQSDLIDSGEQKADDIAAKAE